jgi:hypothetical protein
MFLVIRALQVLLEYTHCKYHVPAHAMNQSHRETPTFGDILIQWNIK